MSCATKSSKYIKKPTLRTGFALWTKYACRTGAQVRGDKIDQTAEVVIILCAAP